MKKSGQVTAHDGYYAVSATIGRTVERGGIDYESVRQVPTFYLHSRVQGILSEGAAVRVATSILNPYADDSLRVHVTAVAV